MNPQIQEFIAELNRLGIKRIGIVSGVPPVEIDYRTASHLYAWVEQKQSNWLVREGRRTGQCSICGGPME